MFKKIATLAALAASSFGLASASTIFFEDFETPQIKQKWYVFDEFGNFVTVDGSGIEIQKSGTVKDSNGDPVMAYDGTQYVELDSDSQRGGSSSDTNSSMAAEVAFVEGHKYRITFAYRPRTNKNNDNGIRVSVGSLDSNNGTFTASLPPLGTADGRKSTQPDWELVSFDFIAGAMDNSFVLAAFGKENELGGFVDAVSVTDLSSIPLPAGVMLMGTGLFVLARRRRAV